MQRETQERNTDKHKETESLPVYVNILHQEQSATGKKNKSSWSCLDRKIQTTNQCDVAHECANAATRGTWIMEAAKEQLRQRIPSSCALLTWPKYIQRNIDNTVRKEEKELVGKVWYASKQKPLYTVGLTG